MLDSISGAEKIGILALIGGFVASAVQAIRWIANFSEEHRLLLEHLKETKPLLQRMIHMEAEAEVNRRERNELLAEVRGLRTDLIDLLKYR